MREAVTLAADATGPTGSVATELLLETGLFLQRPMTVSKFAAKHLQALHRLKNQHRP
jgi:hypothetical protein